LKPAHKFTNGNSREITHLLMQPVEVAGEIEVPWMLPTSWVQATAKK